MTSRLEASRFSVAIWKDPLFLQPLVMSDLLSVSMNMLILDSSCKWNYIKFVFLCLAL